jgi:CPA1 family monovalent cation:H+ antiporter
LLSPSLRQKDPYPPWQSIFLISFTGMRGAISLAAALALPLAIGNQPFAARDLIIFLTFTSIFLTLVIQGLWLPSLIARLGLGAYVEREEKEHQRMEIKARLATAAAGLAKLEVLDQSDNAPHFIAFLRRQYEGRLNFLKARSLACETPEQEEEMLNVMRAVRGAERTALHDLQAKDAITDQVMIEIQEDIDLEQLKFEVEE